MKAPVTTRLYAVLAALAAGPAIAFSPLPDCSLPTSGVTHSEDGIVNAASSGNKLTSDERAQGWQLLFDGKSTSGWRGFDDKAIPRGWRVENGALTLSAAPPGGSTEGRGDIVTEGDFGDFELRLQWAVEPGANSGIFFFAREGTADRIWKTAPEVQVLDDARHKDGALPTHRAGALYDIYEPKCNALKPPGEYNDARLVVRKGHVEHWLNGYKLVEYDLGSDDFRKRVAASKFRNEQQFARVHRGRLGLQDHGDVIRFRNIRLRKL